MSRIGNLNLAIEEKLADLGYRDLDEAEKEGWRLVYIDGELELIRKETLCL